MNLTGKIKLIKDLIKEDPDATINEYWDILTEIEAIEKANSKWKQKKKLQEQLIKFSLNTRYLKNKLAPIALRKKKLRYGN